MGFLDVACLPSRTSFTPHLLQIVVEVKIVGPPPCQLAVSPVLRSSTVYRLLSLFACCQSCPTVVYCLSVTVLVCLLSVLSYGRLLSIGYCPCLLAVSPVLRLSAVYRLLSLYACCQSCPTVVYCLSVTVLSCGGLLSISYCPCQLAVSPVLWLLSLFACCRLLSIGYCPCLLAVSPVLRSSAVYRLLSLYACCQSCPTVVYCLSVTVLSCPTVVYCLSVTVLVCLLSVLSYGRLLSIGYCPCMLAVSPVLRSSTVYPLLSLSACCQSCPAVVCCLSVTVLVCLLSVLSYGRLLSIGYCPCLLAVSPVLRSSVVYRLLSLYACCQSCPTVVYCLLVTVLVCLLSVLSCGRLLSIGYCPCMLAVSPVLRSSTVYRLLSLSACCQSCPAVVCCLSVTVLVCLLSVLSYGRLLSIGYCPCMLAVSPVLRSSAVYRLLSLSACCQSCPTVVYCLSVTVLVCLLSVLSCGGLLSIGYCPCLLAVSPVLRSSAVYRLLSLSACCQSCPTVVYCLSVTVLVCLLSVLSCGGLLSIGYCPCLLAVSPVLRSSAVYRLLSLYACCQSCPAVVYCLSVTVLVCLLSVLSYGRLLSIDYCPCLLAVSPVLRSSTVYRLLSLYACCQSCPAVVYCLSATVLVCLLSVLSYGRLLSIGYCPCLLAVSPVLRSSTVYRLLSLSACCQSCPAVVYCLSVTVLVCLLSVLSYGRLLSIGYCPCLLAVSPVLRSSTVYRLLSLSACCQSCPAVVYCLSVTVLVCLLSVLSSSHVGCVPSLLTFTSLSLIMMVWVKYTQRSQVTVVYTEACDL